MPAATASEVAQIEESVKPEAQERAQPVGLDTMFGNGLVVRIAGKDYEVAPVPIKRLAKVGELISQCPDMLVTHALVAAKNGGAFDASATAEYLTGLMKSATASLEIGPDHPVVQYILSGKTTDDMDADLFGRSVTEADRVDRTSKAIAIARLAGAAPPSSPTLTAEQIEAGVSVGLYSCTEEQCAAMVEAVVLILSRRHPGLTAEDIDGDLEPAHFSQVMRALFLADPHLRQRFFRPATAN